LREKERECVRVGERGTPTHMEREREREKERRGERFTSRVSTCNKMIGQNEGRSEREGETKKTKKNR
jgi:hypothetical protein